LISSPKTAAASASVSVSGFEDEYELADCGRPHSGPLWPSWPRKPWVDYIESVEQLLRDNDRKIAILLYKNLADRIAFNVNSDPFRASTRYPMNVAHFTDSVAMEAASIEFIGSPTDGPNEEVTAPVSLW